MILKPFKSYVIRTLALFIGVMVLCIFLVLKDHHKHWNQGADQDFFYDVLEPISVVPKVKSPVKTSVTPEKSAPFFRLSDKIDWAENTGILKQKDVIIQPPPKTLPPSTETKKVAIILTHVGGNQKAWEGLTSLPKVITLAFQGKNPKNNEKIKTAHARGHECLQMVPMEPMAFPFQDPGQDTLLTGLSSKENIIRLEKYLVSSEIMGITTLYGSRFTTCIPEMLPILKILKKKNKVVVDLNSTPRSQITKICKHQKMSCIQSVYALDPVNNPKEINESFKGLIPYSEKNGFVVAFAKATPFMVQKIKEWHKGLDPKQLELVPLSVILQEQDAHEAP